MSIQHRGSNAGGTRPKSEAASLRVRSPGSLSAWAANSWVEPEASSVRDRLLLAALLAVGRHGYSRFTVGHVVELAGAARGTFYKHFADKTDCFAQAYAAIAETFAARIFVAAGAAPDWRGGVRAGLAEALGLLASEPVVARAVLIESEGAGTRVQTKYAKLTNRFAAALDAARGETVPYRPAQAGTFVVGGIREVVVARLRSGEAAQLPDLLPGLVQFALLPYFGEQIAWAELNAATVRREGDGE